MNWQVRTICTFVAATVPVEKAGDVNPLLESAQAIGLDEDQIKEQKQAPPVQGEPNTGSFERFMSTFGAPQRWAGRG